MASRARTMAWQNSSTWDCSACSFWNWGSAKKCWKCGIKHTYGAAPLNNLPGAGAGGDPPPTGVESHNGVADAAPALPPRAELVCRLRQVDAALAQLQEGPELADLRAPLLAKQEQLKRDISNARPVNMCIDGCRGGLRHGRSHSRGNVASVRDVCPFRDQSRQRLSGSANKCRVLSRMIR